MKKPNIHFLSAGSPLVILRVIAANRFAVSWIYLHRALLTFACSLAAFPLQLIERAWFGRKIRRTRIVQPPVFILGHWRSGTTYMHNLMSVDAQFVSPSTYQCFMPGMFLTGGKALKSFLRMLLPPTRPADAVKLDADYPQEEEFGLCALSHRSYYHALTFPRAINRYFAHYAGMQAADILHWKKEYMYFLHKVQLTRPARRLLCKNPTNTARIRALLGMFPDAKFIYLNREKDSVQNSTYMLYSKLLRLYTWQRISDKEIVGAVHSVYDATMEAYSTQRNSIAPGNLVEVEYEAFIANPLEQMKRIYEGLGLDGFSEASDRFKAYIETQRSYRPNTKVFLKIGPEKVRLSNPDHIDA
jgi:omega-hydroxy-beta-dihydromenaquinone-9 sulfotransferase